MARANAWQAGSVSLFLCLAALLQTGCGSWSSGGGAFSSAPNLDREFAVAAITWDLNRDGDVACNEWKQYVAQLFREADANRDGFLAPEEFAALARSDKLFEIAGFSYYDGNNDKRVTLAEMADKPNPAFALLDKNKDCVISRDERVHRGGSEAPSAGAPAQAPPTGRPKR